MKIVAISDTHGPPANCLDGVKGEGPQGCADLLKMVRQVRPRFHVFGHIHEHGGMTVKHSRELQSISFVNASVLDDSYAPVYKPMVFEI